MGVANPSLRRFISTAQSDNGKGDAIARDPEFGNDFIRRHSERLLFGTDLLYREQEVPILRMREVLDVPDNVYTAITRGNAERLLGLAS